VTVRYLPRARGELREAIRYDEEQRPGLGAEFRDEYVAALERVRLFPESGRVVSPRTRRCLLRRFSHALIFQPLPGEILVVAVAHLSRNPGYGSDRLQEGD
jgi:plasmid stabilization system protein ParE